MILLAAVRKLALAFEGVEEKPHFEKISFRVKNRIFATIDVKGSKVVLKLSEIDQSVFSRYDPSVIYPVAGAWGRQGWTMVEMKEVGKDLFADAITTAYCTVAPARLAAKYKTQYGSN
jgi:predicted DNA-binding protein (MmcQ/YjbR family)